MHYSPDDNFKVTPITKEEAEERDFLKRLSGRYAFVGVLSLPVVVYMIAQHRYIHAFLIWMIGNFSTTMAAYFRQKAKEVGYE